MIKDTFEFETLNFNNFCGFLRANIPLVIVSAVTLFLTYGTVLFNYSFGIDTEGAIIAGHDYFKWVVASGRPFMWILRELWQIQYFNPVFSASLALIILWLFTVSYCYVIAIFSGNTGRNNLLMLFAVLFMSSPVWGEYLYYLNGSVECFFSVLLCPFIVYLYFDSILKKNRAAFILAECLAVFIFLIYQPVVPLFIGVILASFILFCDNSPLDKKTYRRLALSLFTALVIVCAAFFILSRVIPYLFGMRYNNQSEAYSQWGHIPLIKSFMFIALFAYMLTVGGIPFLKEPFEKFASGFPLDNGQETVKQFSHIGEVFGNALLLPVIIIFLCFIIRHIKNGFSKKSPVLYLLAAIALPLTIMMLSILGGSYVPQRTLWALPFAAAFMFYYVVKEFAAGKLVKKAAVLLTLLVCVHQVQITAQILFSDYLRFESDMRLAGFVDKKIYALQDENLSLPVAFVGSYKGQFPKGAFLRGQWSGGYKQGGSDVGTSHFFVNGYAHGFLAAAGFHNYKTASPEECALAEKAADNMRAYPASDCVERVGNLIVVKLMERPYR